MNCVPAWKIVALTLMALSHGVDHGEWVEEVWAENMPREIVLDTASWG